MQFKTIRAFVAVFIIGSSAMGADLPGLPSQNFEAMSTSNTALLSPKVQDYYVRLFMNRYFSPWNKTEARSDVNDIFKNVFRSGTFYGENKLPILQRELEALDRNMDLSHRLKRPKPGILVDAVALRLVPSSRPFYLSFDKAGEGFPFDYAQESGLSPNLPVLVVAVSRDHIWALVETAELIGWVPARSVAYVTKSQMKLIQSRPFITVSRDNIPLLNPAGNYVWSLRIGTVLPVGFGGPKAVTALVARRAENGSAYFDSMIPSEGSVVPFPIPILKKHIAAVATELLGENYGWGDLFGRRDCASMVQDLYAPFGIWLPRNGNDQGLYGGSYFSLKDLNPIEKERLIIANGIPFGTLLWLKGHIMVYVGARQGRALVFHNIWGIRTRDSDGREGRFIIGKSVISTLSPGVGIDNADPKGDILTRVEGMTLLTPKFY